LADELPRHGLQKSWLRLSDGRALTRTPTRCSDPVTDAGRLGGVA
jgi:hypothetical protein